MYRLIIVSSGDGEEHPIGTFRTLVDCSDALDELDKRWMEWRDDGWPELSKDDPIKWYEGCDAYAEDEEGSEFYETGDGCWEESV